MAVRSISRVRLASCCLLPTLLLGSLGAEIQLHKAEATPPYISVCAFVESGSHRDLWEWARYHQCIGVDRIHVFDHASNPPLALQIPDLIKTGFVKYSYVGPRAHERARTFVTRRKYTSARQYAYDSCLEMTRAHGGTWMAVLDTNDYIVVKDRRQPHDLQAYMRDVESAGGAGLAIRQVPMGPEEEGGEGATPRPASEWRTGRHSHCVDSTPSEHLTRMRAQLKHLVRVDSVVRVAQNGVLYTANRGAITERREWLPAGQPKMHSITSQEVAVYHYPMAPSTQPTDGEERKKQHETRRITRDLRLLASIAVDRCTEVQDFGPQCFAAQ